MATPFPIALATLPYPASHEAEAGSYRTATLLAYPPYGVPGLLVVEVDLAEATGLLATRRTQYD